MMRRNIHQETLVLQFNDGVTETVPSFYLINICGLFDDLLEIDRTAIIYEDDDYCNQIHPLEGKISICFPSKLYYSYMYLRTCHINNTMDKEHPTLEHFMLENYLRVYKPIIKINKNMCLTYHNNGKNIFTEIPADYQNALIDNLIEDSSIMSESDINKILQDLINSNINLENLSQLAYKYLSYPMIELIINLPSNDPRVMQYKKWCKKYYKIEDPRLIYSRIDHVQYKTMTNKIKDPELFIIITYIIYKKLDIISVINVLSLWKADD